MLDIYARTDPSLVAVYGRRDENNEKLNIKVKQQNKTLNKTLNEVFFKVISIKLSTLTVNEFYKGLAFAFNLDGKAFKRKNFKVTQDES